MDIALLGRLPGNHGEAGGPAGSIFSGANADFAVCLLQDDELIRGGEGGGGAIMSDEGQGSERSWLSGGRALWRVANTRRAGKFVKNWIDPAHRCADVPEALRSLQNQPAILPNLADPAR